MTTQWFNLVLNNRHTTVSQDWINLNITFFCEKSIFYLCILSTSSIIVLFLVYWWLLYYTTIMLPRKCKRFFVTLATLRYLLERSIVIYKFIALCDNNEVINLLTKCNDQYFSMTYVYSTRIFILIHCLSICPYHANLALYIIFAIGAT